MNPVEYTRSDDPLYRDLPLDYTVTIPVLGIPVRFASNARVVIDVVEDAFRAWRVLERHADHVEENGARVTIVVHPDDEGDDSRVRLRFRIIGAHRFLLGSGANMAVVDPDRREALAWVSPAFAADTQHFRYSLVEALTMGLVTPLDRQPFHAACLVRGRAAVLLNGPSGVGKSSLTYAAIRNMPDVTALAEDAVYLQSSPAPRVWGLPGYVHVPRDITRVFRDLDAASPVVLANGKIKIAVDLRAIGAAASLPFVDRAAVCVLTRGNGPPALEPMGGDALLDRLLSGLEDGFDLFSDTIEEPLRLLSRHGGWLLTLPPSPMDALPWLDHILRQVDAAAA